MTGTIISAILIAVIIITRAMSLDFKDKANNLWTGKARSNYLRKSGFLDFICLICIVIMITRIALKYV